LPDEADKAKANEANKAKAYEANKAVVANVANDANVAKEVKANVINKIIADDEAIFFDKVIAVDAAKANKAIRFCCCYLYGGSNGRSARSCCRDMVGSQGTGGSTGAA
jgi:hypothetical protein